MIKKKPQSVGYNVQFTHFFFFFLLKRSLFLHHVMEGSGSLLFRQLQAVGVGEKLLNPFWDIGKTVRVYFGCMRPNVLAFIHPQLIIKTQTPTHSSC